MMEEKCGLPGCNRELTSSSSGQRYNYCCRLHARQAEQGELPPCSPRGVTPFPILFVLNLLRNQRPDPELPAPDLDQVATASAGTASTLGHSELTAYLLLKHARGRKPLSAAVFQQLSDVATEQQQQLEQQLDLQEQLISLHEEWPSIDLLQRRHKWPFYAYTARIDGDRLVASGFEKDTSRRATRHYFGYRDRFLTLKLPKYDAAVDLRDSYEFLGRKYAYLLDKDHEPQLRYFASMIDGPQELQSVQSLLRSAPFGDYSSVAAGKLGERIGLSFSDTVPLLRVAVGGGMPSVDDTSARVTLLDPLFKHGYDFSDGQGHFGDDVAQSLKLHRKSHPDAIQMRVFGAKGVLVHMPGTRGIALRASMIKYISGYPILECCKRADSRAAAKPLIRQFIYLLESRQAPVRAFLDLFQLSLSKRLGKAVDAKLSVQKQRAKLEELASALRYEAIKGRLEVPFERCVLGMGCVDEHDCLAADEVLVDDGRLTAERTPVLVGRSPAYHPGDLRILFAVPKPPTLQVSRRGCVMFSSAGARPVFDAMGRGDVDGDQYYVLSHRELVQGLTLPDARDYESQTAMPQKFPFNPCNPSHNHKDPPLRAAFATLQILTKPHTGGVRGLSRAVTEWMATCDQLGASSSTAIRLVDLVMKAHSVRSLCQVELERFEEEFACQVLGPQLAMRPDYLDRGASDTESHSVVGLLALRAKVAAEQMSRAILQLKQRPVDHAQIVRHLVASCLPSDQTSSLSNEVLVEKLELQRAMARSEKAAEQHVQSQPQLLSDLEERDRQMAQMLHSEINDVSVERPDSVQLETPLLDTQIQELARRREQIEAQLASTGLATQQRLGLQCELGDVAKEELELRAKQLGRTTECAVHGCGRSVWADPDGVESVACSRKHLQLVLEQGAASAAPAGVASATGSTHKHVGVTKRQLADAIANVLGPKRSKS